jgi:threonine aldolase
MAKLQFASDYACSTHPVVADATHTAMLKHPGGASYGEDADTVRASRLIHEAFGGGHVLYTDTGTAANVIALETLLGHRCNAVVCAPLAHIIRHECGGIQSRGYTVLTLPATNTGKINPHNGDLPSLVKRHAEVHCVRPTILSVSNATETGAVYTLAELEAIGEVARKLRLKIHVDGARLWHAAAHYGHTDFRPIRDALKPAAITLSATKNGGVHANAIIFFDKILYATASLLHKQQGHLCPRTHVLAAEFTALFSDKLGMSLAQTANQKAALLSRLCRGLSQCAPVESDSVFFRLPKSLVTERLQNEVEFTPWGEEEHDLVIRIMTSWATTEADVDALAEILKGNY